MANSTSLRTSNPPPLLLLLLRWRHLARTGGQSSSPFSSSFFTSPAASQGVTSLLLLLPLLFLLLRGMPLSCPYFKFPLLPLATLPRDRRNGDTRVDDGKGVNHHIQAPDLGHRGPLWGLPAGEACCCCSGSSSPMGPLMLILLLLLLLLLLFLLPVPGSDRDGLFVAPALVPSAHFT